MARLQSIATAFNAGMDHFYKHCIRYGTVQCYTDYIDHTGKECRIVTVIIQGMQASITKRNGEDFAQNTFHSKVHIMNIESSNLTHREYLHLNGMLSQERTEQALDDLDNAISYDVREFAPYAQEARCGYASEDFAQEEVKDLREFAKRLRGGNKQDLLMYIEALESRIHELVLSAEYGNEQLNKIIQTIVK